MIFAVTGSHDGGRRGSPNTVVANNFRDTRIAHIHHGRVKMTRRVTHVGEQPLRPFAVLSQFVALGQQGLDGFRTVSHVVYRLNKRNIGKALAVSRA